jgi:hypothetical protein
MTAVAGDGLDILGVSAKMLASAQADAWDDVAAHGTERDRLLRLLPMSGPSALELLQTLQAHNEQIKALVGKARDDLGEALGQHRRTHRALSAYLHTAID